MSVITITDTTDQRLWPFLNTPDRELAAQSELFIAEGEHLTRRLLESDCKTHALLVSSRRIEEIAAITPSHIPIYTTDDDTVNSILGYRFHSGVMGAGYRKPNATIESIMTRAPSDSTGAAPSIILICPEVHNSENLGSIIRLGAAFNCRALLLGERCCDPWWRRSVRVSMGSIFHLPIARSNDLAHDLLSLKQQWGVDLIATVVGDPSATPLTHDTPVPSSIGLLIGSESQGLANHWVYPCQHRLTIPMHQNTDSLNVAIATSIFLWHFTQTSASSQAPT